MNNKRSVARWISGLYCVAAVTAIVTGQLARGQEEVPPLPPDHRARQLIIFNARQTEAIERAGESLLSELGPGFTITVTKTPAFINSAFNDAAASSCNANSACSLGVVRCQVAGAASCNEVCTFDAPTGLFVKQGCPCIVTGDCQCGDVCRCAKETGCGSECLASCTEQACEAGCGEDACDIALAHAEEAAEHHHEHFRQRIHVQHDQLDLVQHLVELVADRAAVRTELECRKEASAKMADLYETLAELIAVNAALEAKLEAQVEHTKTLEKVAELAAENARLKTHVELAGGRSDSTQQMFSLTLENERLKLRLADLEHRQATSEASQTAERSLRDRKTR
jgi:hypothetical protein